ATVTVTVGPPLPAYQNPTNRLDVNNDTFITPIDALFVINYLNTVPGGVLPPVGSTPPTIFIDVDGNNLVTTLDALLVINRLNSSSGEGEVAGVAPDTGIAVSGTAGEMPVGLAATSGAPTSNLASFGTHVIDSGLANSPLSTEVGSRTAFVIPTAVSTDRRVTADSSVDPASDSWMSIADELATELSSDLGNASNGSSDDAAADAALADLFG
ncbi:MAG: dockerin type I domain-containing protein, partial [Planctomycetota bacterium]